MSDPKRDLHLVTPYLQGGDVKELQHGINVIAEEKKNLGLRKLQVDGEAGPHTFGAAARSAYAVGLKMETVHQIKNGLIDKGAQIILEDPSKRGDDAHKRAVEREGELIKQAQRQHSGSDAAVKWAMDQIGTTEHPPGSNWGEPVETWIKETGYSGPVYWCGCFVHHAVVNVGKANIPSSGRLGYNGYIESDARASVNGLEAVSLTECTKGCIITFSFHHIALALGPIEGGLVHTVDGNSSASDGNNNNGGEVAEHRRSTGLVSCVAKVDW